MSEEKIKLPLGFLEYRFLYSLLSKKVEDLKSQEQTPAIKEEFTIMNRVKERLWKKMED
jgi:hypothetical protein